MKSHDQVNIAIIGKGKVGSSLAQLFNKAGHSTELIGRSFKEQQAACLSANVIILSVGDSEIEALCQQLSPHLKNGSTITHCSGSIDSSALASATQCHRASTHPLNTFPTLSAALERFADFSHDSHLYAEGDTTATAVLLPLFEEIGFKTKIIKPEAKTLYHAACVFACNYLNCLMDMSLQTAEAAGLERKEFWRSVQPLVQATLENIGQHGTQDALSGPIARGDHDTVISHLNALKQVSPELQASYTDLALRALQLAANKGELSVEKINAIKDLLS